MTYSANSELPSGIHTSSSGAAISRRLVDWLLLVLVFAAAKWATAHGGGVGVDYDDVIAHQLNLYNKFNSRGGYDYSTSNSDLLTSSKPAILDAISSNASVYSIRDSKYRSLKTTNKNKTHSSGAKASNKKTKNYNNWISNSPHDSNNSISLGDLYFNHSNNRTNGREKPDGKVSQWNLFQNLPDPLNE